MNVADWLRKRYRDSSYMALANLAAQLYEDHVARACAHSHDGKTCLEYDCNTLCPRCNSIRAAGEFREKYG